MLRVGRSAARFPPILPPAAPRIARGDGIRSVQLSDHLQLALDAAQDKVQLESSFGIAREIQSDNVIFFSPIADHALAGPADGSAIPRADIDTGETLHASPHDTAHSGDKCGGDQRREYVRRTLRCKGLQQHL